MLLLHRCKDPRPKRKGTTVNFGSGPQTVKLHWKMPTYFLSTVAVAPLALKP